jgi:Cellulose biosynthesis protein BcsS
VYALNGDLYSSGLLLRGFFGAGQYDYNATNLLNQEVTGSIYDVAVGAGYRQQLGNSFSITGFVSPHVRWRSLDQLDPENQVESVKWGVQFGAELYGRTGPISWDLIGQFTTIESSFWGRARVGYEFERVNFGPEYSYNENGQFSEHRVGGFIGFKPCACSRITLNGGHAIYQFGNGADQSSLYVGLSFSYNF